MKQLLGLLFLMGLVQAQTFSGTSGGDIFVLPPFRSCLGADDGGQACFIQEGTNVAKLAGRLHATLGAQLGPVFFANLPTGTIDGTVLYVQDGSVTNPCTGGGTGAFAYRVLGAWNCSAASSSLIPSGTLNHLVIYTSSSAIGSDAALTDSGGTLGYTGGVFNATNSTSFTIQTAGGFNITETGTNKAANWNISGQLTVNTGTSLAAGLDGLGETRVTGSPTGEAKTGGNFAVWAGNAAGVGLTNANGGNFWLTPGLHSGSGTDGAVQIGCRSGSSPACPFATSITGVTNYWGKTSGVVSVSAQDAAGTWGFKWPTSAPSGNAGLLQSDTTGVTSFGAAPTISSGFGSSPSIANQNGPQSFTVNVGTGGAASTGTVGLPTASHGWHCECVDITTNTSTVFACKQTGAGTTTTVPIGEFTAAGAAQAWTASDIVAVSCFAY